MKRKELTTGIFFVFFFLIVLSFVSVSKMGLTSFAISSGVDTSFSVVFIIALLGLITTIYYFFMRQR